LGGTLDHFCLIVTNAGAEYAFELFAEEVHLVISLNNKQQYHASDVPTMAVASSWWRAKIGYKN
jgi:hypothetical protein